MPHTNQPQKNIPDSHGRNRFDDDPMFNDLLRIYLTPEDYQHLMPVLTHLGAGVGGYIDDLALSADKHPPTLQSRTRTGEDIQTLNKHPDYIRLEHIAFCDLGLAAMTHRGGVHGRQKPWPAQAKYALTYLFVQAEFGLCCPVSMTDSLANTLCRYGDPTLIERYITQLTSTNLDTLYQGAMFMTEEGAGSDVSAITTEAYQEHGVWKIKGDKWFCSNPDADLALILARPVDGQPGLKGLGLFLLPKNLDNGKRNAYRIIRLKDKLGTRSMASGEITLEGATAYLIGTIGQGFQQMADMINMSRLSNGVRAAGLMRRAVSEAFYIARHRSAFNQTLIDMPLMQRQLVKILLPAEQARSMFMHTARCLEQAQNGDLKAQKLVRILTPLFKFRACRDARKVTGDAMEVRGGCGFIEEWGDPKIVRDAHLGSIWEGTSNIIALDVMRSIKRNDTLAALHTYLQQLLHHPNIPKASATQLNITLDQVVAFTNTVATAANDLEVRKASTALYHCTTAIFMAWEAAHISDDSRRLALAHLVLTHKLSPINPLASPSESDQHSLTQLISKAPLSLETAMQLLPH